MKTIPFASLLFALLGSAAGNMANNGKKHLHLYVGLNPDATCSRPPFRPCLPYTPRFRGRAEPRGRYRVA